MQLSNPFQVEDSEERANSTECIPMFGRLATEIQSPICACNSMYRWFITSSYRSPEANAAARAAQ
jgi:hypothetical protein